MKPTIFISGGGGIRDTYLVDRAYFGNLKNDAKILYIPLALNLNNYGLGKLKEWFISLIKFHNKRQNKFDILTEDMAIPDLIDYDAIYIGGGNTYKLLDYLIKTGLVEKLRTFVEEDKVIYGGSAGAIVLGKDIRTVAEENDKSYNSHSGLNLLGGHSIICHYQIPNPTTLESLESLTGSPIFALPENTGISFSKYGRIIEKYGEVVITSKSS